jgi:hypothetical protein
MYEQLQARAYVGGGAHSKQALLHQNPLLPSGVTSGYTKVPVQAPASLRSTFHVRVKDQSKRYFFLDRII